MWKSPEIYFLIVLYLNIDIHITKCKQGNSWRCTRCEMIKNNWSHFKFPGGREKEIEIFNFDLIFTENLEILFFMFFCGWTCSMRLIESFAIAFSVKKVKEVREWMKKFEKLVFEKLSSLESLSEFFIFTSQVSSMSNVECFVF